MQKIDLTPQNFGTLYDTIVDIGAFVCEMTTSDALTKTFVNQLEGQKAISGFFVLQKDGASDVFMTIIDSSSFSITRTVNVNVKVGVFLMKLVAYNENVFRALYEWQQDDETRKGMGGLSVPMTEDEAMFAYNQFLNGNAAVLGVATEEGTIVGAFMMSQIFPRHKRMDIHYVFDKNHLRHVKEGFTLFLDFVFNEQNMEWLHVYIDVKNLESCNVVERLGFIKRCVIPEYFNFSDGLTSANMYSLSKLKRKDK